MHHAAVIALGVATGSTVVAFLISRRVRPATTAFAITVLAALSAVSTLWALLVIVGSNVIDLHVGAEHVPNLGLPRPMGAAAIVALAAMSRSALRVRSRQRLLRAPAGHRELAVVQSEVPTAYALPGSPGQIVVSTGMLRSLAPDERRVLLAHERAHLRCHHHRYVRLTQLAAAVLPLLAPLNARVRHATECWADEEAVQELGDRSVVARAIARAAMAQTEAVEGALGIADTGVVQRVESLLQDAPRPSHLLELGLTFAITCAFGGLTYSLMHIGPWMTALIGH